MSRAIVINTGAIKKMVQKIQQTVTAIKKAGLPQQFDDFSTASGALDHMLLPGADMSDRAIMALLCEGPVPLSLTENFMVTEFGIFPLTENFMSESKNVALAHTEVAHVSKTPLIIDSYKKPEIVETADNPCEVVTVKSGEINNTVSIEDHLMATDALMASLQHSNLEVKKEENVASNVTKITVQELLGESRARIPEYAVLRRG